jgi:hypothetical protein
MMMMIIIIIIIIMQGVPETEEERNAHKIFVGNPKRMRPLERQA